MFSSLIDAKNWLRDRIVEGDRCPCCNQFAKVYRRPITGAMAGVLIVMYNHCKDYNHIEKLLKSLPVPASLRGDYSKLKFWGLIEKQDIETDNNSNSSGMWKITKKGNDFVEGKITVEKYAKIYNDKRLGLEGAQISIRESLKQKFNYDKLMGI